MVDTQTTHDLIEVSIVVEEEVVVSVEEEEVVVNVATIRSRINSLTERIIIVYIILLIKSPSDLSDGKGCSILFFLLLDL